MEEISKRPEALDIGLMKGSAWRTIAYPENSFRADD